MPKWGGTVYDINANTRHQFRKRMKRKHGDDYFAGVCPICQLHYDNLCIDHDKATGKIRSLICTDCNIVLGKMSDDPDRLQRAAEYLKYHHGKQILGL